MEAGAAPQAPVVTGENGSPPDAPIPPVIERAAAGDESLTGKDERDALDFLLGATRALEYNVTVQYDTPDGLKPLIFHIQQLDAARIDTIDAENRVGDGPFAKLNVREFNAALVTEATVYLQTPGGRRIMVPSEEFLGGAPSGPMAMGLRFKYQPGILEGMAEVIRGVSAYSPDRVGSAQRVLVEAGKDS